MKKHSRVVLSISKHRQNLAQLNWSAQKQPVCRSQSARPEFRGIQIFATEKVEKQISDF